MNWSPELSSLCHKAKNLYNYALWLVKEGLKWISPAGKAFWFRERALRDFIRYRKVFRAIPISVAGQVIKRLDENWKSFFAALKEWKKDPTKFKAKPEPPRFLRKDGETPAYFDYTGFTVQKGGEVRFVRNCIPPMMPPQPVLDAITPFNHLPKRNDRRGSLCQIRILPRVDYYVIEYVFEREEKTPSPNSSRAIGIDLNIDNLVACVNNCGIAPFVIKGGPAKSANQQYNKVRADLRSRNDQYFNALLKKHNGDKRSVLQQETFSFETRRLRQITRKRNNRIHDYFHKVSRFIIDFCEKNKIGTIVVGYNQGWKQEVNIGAQNNQNFTGLPHLKLKQMLSYKAKLAGIQFLEINEDYTSLCSFLDGESVEKHATYAGKRLSHRLYRASSGTILNADLNDAYNILRKALPDAFADGIGGARLHPIPITLGNKHPRAAGVAQSSQT